VTYLKPANAHETICIMGDFKSDGKPDLLWRNAATGCNVIWFMNDTTVTGSASLSTVPGPDWNIILK